MNFFIPLSDAPEKELVPGFFFKMIHTDKVTVAHVWVRAGSVLPEHQHVHEQVSNVLEGEFEMTVGGHTQLCQAGDVVSIPSSVPHSARAITDCYIVDVFCPVREEYK